MEAWIMIGPVIFIVTAMIHSAGLYPVNNYYFGRYTGDDFRDTEAGANLKLRFRLMLAAGTTLTIILNASQAFQYHLLSFAPLFVVPIAGWLWNWHTARAFEIPLTPSTPTPDGPIVPEPLPAGLLAMLVLGPAISILSVALAFYQAHDRTHFEISLPAVFIYWVVTVCANAYALSRHSRPYEARRLQIRTLAGQSLLFGLCIPVVQLAVAINAGNHSGWYLAIFFLPFLAMLFWFSHRFPAIESPDGIPTGQWIAGFLYINPSDPAWIVPRPDGRSLAPNLGRAPAWGLILPHLLLPAWFIYLLRR